MHRKCVPLDIVNIRGTRKFLNCIVTTYRNSLECQVQPDAPSHNENFELMVSFPRKRARETMAKLCHIILSVVDLVEVKSEAVIFSHVGFLQ